MKLSSLINVLKQFNSQDVSLTLNLMFECALQNAGFDGRGNALEYFTYEEAEEVRRHIACFVDARQFPDATGDDYAAACKLLDSLK